MKKFRFKLVPLQKHRKLIEQEKRVELSKSLNIMKGIESKLLEIDENEVRARRAYANLGEMGAKSSLTSSQFWVIDKFIQGQKFRRVQTKTEMEKQEAIVQQNYSAYVKARQNLKVIETLRDKEFTRYKKELQRYEMKQLDDVYTMRDRLSERVKTRKGEEGEE